MKLNKNLSAAQRSRLACLAAVVEIFKDEDRLMEEFTAAATYVQNGDIAYAPTDRSVRKLEDLEIDADDDV